MSYLDNSTIVVDSILTKRGRELMSQGKLNITKFALADDEVNYSLYNTSHNLGSNYYAAAIENTPVLEAFPDGTKMMRYKLITLPKGTSIIPVISVPSTSITLKNGSRSVITPSTLNGLNAVNGYTATLVNSQYVTLSVVEGIANPPAPSTSTTAVSQTTDRVASATSSDEAVKIVDKSSSMSISLIGKSFSLVGKQLPTNTSSITTKLIITGNETGGQVEISVIIQNTQSAQSVV